VCVRERERKRKEERREKRKEREREDNQKETFPKSNMNTIKHIRGCMLFRETQGDISAPPVMDIVPNKALSLSLSLFQAGMYLADAVNLSLSLSLFLSLSLSLSRRYAYIASFVADTCHELLPVVCDGQNGLRPR